MILFRILEHSREMDELVESDKQEDLQSSPYNTPVHTDDSNHSRDSLCETKSTRLITVNLISLTQHTDHSYSC